MRQVRRKGARRRQRAQRRGRLAEWLCLWHLRLRGWHILARGWRCPAGEIDILARRGKVLAVIEVKSRGELAVAAAALAPRSDGGSLAPPKPFCSSDPTSPVSTSDST
jgi:putative endonuclease